MMAKKKSKPGDYSQHLDKLLRELAEEQERSMLVHDIDAHVTSITDRDSFRAITIGHARLENAILLLLERQIYFRGKVNTAYLGYGAKLMWCSALGELRDHEIPTLKVLGSIRNRFSHRLNATLLPTDATEIRNEGKQWTAFHDLLPLAVRVLMAGKNRSGVGGDIIFVPGFPETDAVIRGAIWVAHLLLVDRLREPRAVHPMDRFKDNDLGSLVNENENDVDPPYENEATDESLE
jgi:hypothetical protein